ncbi:hypothetical protein [Paenibacillus guangzhouensis]|uniref:hypothetical protein n=1 Tax=Paenibacillus guangzhouensis TaxID=1473112 RepID=UPI00126777D8|nr:hypothetical protein [Paenibacillus guangzhouensis]
MLWTIIFFIGLALFCASLGFLLHAMLERNHRRLLFVILTLVSYGVVLYSGVQAIDEYKIRHAIKERATIKALKELTPPSGKNTSNITNPPQ